MIYFQLGKYFGYSPAEIDTMDYDYINACFMWIKSSEDKNTGIAPIDRQSVRWLGI